MKKSSSSFGQAAFSTGGNLGSLGLRNDQKLSASSKSISFVPALASCPSRGSGAPISIHCLKLATTGLAKRVFGGITSSESR
ncbi:MAG: hypothetical protein QF497_15695 [Verrucomicrobiota bacterium]|nr:hypothetical protein [Verrucomicrobiota bacterium]